MQILAKIKTVRLAEWRAKDGVLRNYCIVSLKVSNKEIITINVYNKFARLFLVSKGRFTSLTIKDKKNKKGYTFAKLDQLYWIKSSNGEIVYQTRQTRPQSLDKTLLTEQEKQTVAENSKAFQFGQWLGQKFFNFCQP